MNNKYFISSVVIFIAVAIVSSIILTNRYNFNEVKTLIGAECLVRTNNVTGEACLLGTSSHCLNNHGDIDRCYIDGQ